ncbi:helix-turn-helix transcriptional regulator [Nocardioides sp.]|uniref:ArsR/SmtB family transcription factor n=1 Tax=Nocardioides sp. TaxID=35761 RepID=UPI00273496C6|nr:metalloregulator ArsR/SmtB family transcription factor [Nocardioides sp.]MDP3891941.1 metalloregulator ArsR/SmtB family transcription factor [Nocardioides sp.]
MSKAADVSTPSAAQPDVGDDHTPGPPELAPGTHEFLKALANPSRQRVMLLFAKGGVLSVGEVAEQAGLGQSTASEHLAALRRGGIVTSERHGKVVLYRADRAGVRTALSDLQAYLLACC